MRQFHKISIFLLLLMFSVASVGAFAQNQPTDTNTRKQECAGKKRRGDKFSRIPDLTEEQKNQIEEIRNNFESETESVKQELRDKRETLRSLVTRGDGNKEQIDTLIDEIGALKTSMMKNKVAMDMDVRSILTEEQLDFINSIPQHPHRHKKGMRRG